MPKYMLGETKTSVSKSVQINKTFHEVVEKNTNAVTPVNFSQY